MCFITGYTQNSFFYFFYVNNIYSLHLLQKHEAYLENLWTEFYSKSIPYQSSQHNCYSFADAAIKKTRIDQSVTDTVQKNNEISKGNVVLSIFVKVEENTFSK